MKQQFDLWVGTVVLDGPKDSKGNYPRKFEKTYIKRPGIFITPEQAEILNGGNLCSLGCETEMYLAHEDPA